jgi:hypothetical protein
MLIHDCLLDDQNGLVGNGYSVLLIVALIVAVLPLAPEMFAVPESLIVATVTSDEVQVASVVTSIVLPSSKVPTALNCFWVPVGPLARFGVSASETMVAVLTVSADVLLTTPAMS